MARELTILLKAKNAMQVGLAHAKRSLEDFGASALRIGKFFATTFLAAGTAIAGFAVKALAAFAQAQAAENSMSAALQAYGDEVAVNTEKVKQFTAAIQDETGADGDALVAVAARLRMLGVQTSQLESATRATVALKSAGMEEEAASKALALAYSGNYTQLARYIPALRSANTESEKAAILADFVAKGYEQQKAKLNTVAGQWGLLKERVSDVWEEVGRAIEQNGALQGVMEKAGDAIKRFGAKITEWIDGGGMTDLMATLAYFFEDLRTRFQMAGNTVSVVWSSISDGAESCWNYIFNVVRTFAASFGAQMQFIKDVAAAAWNAIQHPFAVGWQPPSIEPMKKAIGDFVDAVKGKDAAVSKQTEAALAEREGLEQAHAERVAGIAEWQTNTINAQREKRVQQAVVAIAAEEQLEQEAATKVEDTASALTAALATGLEARKTNEAAALDTIVGLHESAAGEAAAAWDTVDPFAGVSAQVDRTARDESKWSKGGTVTSSGTNSGAALLGSGMYRDFTTGGSLGGSIADEINWAGGRTGERILTELEQMNQNQKQLLKLG